MKDANNVTLGRLLAIGQGPSVSVLTSTGYEVSIPLNGSLSSLPTAQMYLNNATCVLATAADRIWLNSGWDVAESTYGKSAVWGGPTISSYLVPMTVDANFVSTSGAMTGVVAILNPGCGTSSSTNWGWELRKATNAELGLPATIVAPLQLPTN